MTYEAVAEAHGLTYTPLADVLQRFAALGQLGQLVGFAFAWAFCSFALSEGEILTTAQVTAAESARIATM